MNEQRQPIEIRNGRPPAEDEVGRLIHDAGPRLVVPKDDLESIQAVARAEWRMMVDRQTARSPFSRLLPSLAYAAGLVALVGGLWLWRTQAPTAVPIVVATVEVSSGSPLIVGGASDRGLTAGDELAAGSEIITDSTSRAALVVADGRSLRLDRDSHLRLVSGSQVELERGAVYVDSGPNPRHDAGLMILTSFGEVTEIGTQYEVRLAPGEDSLRVRVREGRVQVHRASGDVEAVRGEELTVHADGPPVRAAIRPDGALWDWARSVSPRPEDDSVRSVLEWATRELGFELQYADRSFEPTLAEKVSGVDGLSAELSVLDDVLDSSGLARDLDGDVLRIRAAR